MSPTAEQTHYSTETYNECSRLVHSGRMQAGIQYLMRRWRAIPEDLQTRFLHAEFRTLPADTQAGINDLLLVRSREAGITERTADLRHQMRERRAQNTRLDAVEVQGVGHRAVHPGLAAPAAVVVLADEDPIGEQGHHRPGRRVGLRPEVVYLLHADKSPDSPVAVTAAKRHR